MAWRRWWKRTGAEPVDALFVFANRQRSRMKILYWRVETALPMAKAAGESIVCVAGAGSGPTVTLSRLLS